MLRSIVAIWAPLDGREGQGTGRTAHDFDRRYARWRHASNRVEHDERQRAVHSRVTQGGGKR